MQVLPVAPAIETFRVNANHRRREEIDMEILVAESYFRRVELPGRIAPIQRPKQPLRPVFQLLPADFQTNLVSFRRAEFDVSLPDIEGITKETAAVFLARRA